MAGSKSRSYAQVYEDAQRGYAAAQLADPDSHFPYKREQVLDALHTPPAEGTNNHPEHWYTSEAIIDASAAYVQAQEAYLKDPGDATKEAYNEAARGVVAARQAHRRGRPAAPLAVAGDPNEIESRRSAMRALGAQGYDAEFISRSFGRSLAEVQGALAGLED
jgi:hypothetical protein